MNTYSVYALINPLTSTCFYVGATANIKQRTYEHLCNRVKDNKEKQAIIAGIKNAGLLPVITIVQSNIETKSEAERIESETIKKYLSLGHNLTNKNEGGNKPPVQAGVMYSDERKLKSLEASPLKKTILQLSKDGKLIGEYVSVREASRKTGIDHRIISQVASQIEIKDYRTGRMFTRKTAGGYNWKYK